MRVAGRGESTIEDRSECGRVTSARGASDGVRGRGTETDRDRCGAMREKEEGETGVKGPIFKPGSSKKR